MEKINGKGSIYCRAILNNILCAYLNLKNYEKAL